jgi:hypothetical protein
MTKKLKCLLKARESDKCAQCFSKGREANEFCNDPTGNFWYIEISLNQANIQEH